MKLSVIIPFYNLEHYVRECLDSVVSAFSACNIHLPDIESTNRRIEESTNLPSTEVICVDDGSTDTTGRLLDEYAAEHNLQSSIFNLQFSILHQPNGGEGAARNIGLAAATGDWVTFLDGDDVWLANMLTTAVRRIVAHPEADLVAFRYADFDDGKPPPPPTAAIAPDRVYDLKDGVPDEVIINAGVFPTFFRREVLSASRFSALPLGADRLFMAERFAELRKIVISDEVVHGYRIRPGSMARAVWNERKVKSQCDYAHGALVALAASGRPVGSAASAYLASLWLSDVPARIARIKSEVERRETFMHWLMTLNGTVDSVLPPRYRRERKVLSTFPRRLVISLARLMRAIGF